MHSGKDKIERISLIGIVDGLGKFQFISHSFPGSIPDNTSLHLNDLVDVVELVTENEFLVADTAFLHIRKYCENVLIPKYPDEEKELNSSISKYRSLIEISWCQIEKWSIIQKYRMICKEDESYKIMCEQHNKIMTIICSIYNIFNEPLGESSSLPSKYRNLYYGQPNINYHKEIFDRCDQTVDEYINKNIF